MEQFSLEKYLENPSRKVVTRLNKQVQIISTEGRDDIPIIALVEGIAHQYKSNGYHADVVVAYSNQCRDMGDYDLFFVDDEEELSEFEKELQIIISNASHWTSDDGSISTYCQFGDKEIKKISGQILDLVRKKLEKDIYDNGYRMGYGIGKQDALKVWPKLEKSKAYIDPTIPVMYTNAASMKTYVEYNGYTLCINDVFEKLPKEEQL